MDWKIALTLSILGLVIIGITALRAAPDLVLLGALTILLICDVVPQDRAFSGFSNAGLITVAVLFVVADGLTQTGSLAFAGQQLLGRPASVRMAQTRVMIPSALLSAFLNNTPVVALMMPLIADWARKHRMSVSHLLLPLSYAAILGGMCTLVGTSTTLVVNNVLPPEHRLSMFEIAWVGVPAMICGMIYTIAFARWLLPERKPAFTPLDDPREYTVEMLIDPDSALVGRSIEEAGLRHLPGMYLAEIDRQGHVMAAVAPSTVLEANDQLVFVGIVESVVDLQRIPGLKPATNQVFKLDSARSERCLVEAVVSSSCPYLRMTIRDARFRTNYNAAVIAVARDGVRLRNKIGDIEICAGDTLLMECHPSFIDQQRNSRHFFLVSRIEGSTPPRHERAWIARSILVAMVMVVTLGWLTMLQAALLAAALMLLTRCSRGSTARRSIDWSVLLAMGAGLGIYEAMKVSGTAGYIASGLIKIVGQRETLMLAVIYGLTMLLTNLITAKAAALLALPIAFAAADSLHADQMPFAIAVIIAAAASFATPVGYQTNLMVYGPGGYRSSDYLRIGGPLSLIIWLLTVLITPYVWSFHPP